MLASLVALAVTSGHVQLAHSKDFERPAWVQVSVGSLSSELQFPKSMAIRAGTSPKGKWLLAGTVPFSEPVMGWDDGYGLLDSRGLTGAFDLKLYRLGEAEPEAIKSFSARGTWEFAGWTGDERYALIVGGPPMMVNDQVGPYRVYVLDTANLKLTEVAHHETVNSACFRPGPLVEVTTKEYRLRGDSMTISRWRWTTDVMGRLMKKRRLR